MSSKLTNLQLFISSVTSVVTTRGGGFAAVRNLLLLYLVQKPGGEWNSAPAAGALSAELQVAPMCLTSVIKLIDLSVYRLEGRKEKY